MRKLVTFLLMLVLTLSFSLTAYAKNAAVSPSGKPVVEEGTTVVESPKTGENEIALYGLGTAAVLLASGAAVVKKKAV